MGSLLKNRILKHLSKFSKNLSHDQINISTLKGEGELTNLELDEALLMDLLDLPTWMRLTKAICNKVSIKIQWTKLKSQPICLILDEVVLEIETCPELRPPNNPDHKASYRAEGKYGFVDKVIDGIYVFINSVLVQFKSQTFQASLQLSRVKVHSVSPLWSETPDLRQTRLRNEAGDEILLFKEVDWQTTKIEANANPDENTIPSTPLRLIANQSKIRIALKKRLSDCSSIASRIILLLDDILWVLTDTQLKAAILYGNSLRDMIEKSAEQSKKMAADKLQKQNSVSSGADQLYLQQQQQQRARAMSNEMKTFQKFDIATTSYHLITSRIDLHLCDDVHNDKETSPKHNRQIDGGAMQITFHKLSVDVYPYHFAGGERKNWYRYTDNQGSRNSWVQELFRVFRSEATKARETCKVISPSVSPSHSVYDVKSPSKGQHSRSSSSSGQEQSRARSQSQTQGQPTSSNLGQPGPKPMVTKLLESCVVLKIEEFIIYRVSTADNKRSTPQKFFSSDKKALHLPADMSMVHIEYTDYFFTEGIDYPVPHANLYVLINPVRLHLDYLTLLWANYFSLNLAQSVEPQQQQQQTETDQSQEHIDIKVEALMPRIVISAEEKVEHQPDRPESLQIQISKITASNTHVETRFTFSDLRALLDQYKNCDIFTSCEFPNDNNNLTSIPQLFHDFAHARLNPYLCGYADNLLKGKGPDGFSEKDLGDDAVKMLLRKNTLKCDARCDMWAVCADQVWLEFLGVPTSRTRPVPFVESVPLTLWICRPANVPDGVISPSNSSSLDMMSVRSDVSDDNVLEERNRRRSKKLLKEYYSQDSEDTSETSHSNSVDSNISKQQTCDRDLPQQAGNVQSDRERTKIADLNIVAKIGGKVRAQLNHPQYLFLMRLLESMSNFQLQLNADVDDLMPGETTSTSSPALCFSIPLIIQELEFSMVCPYIAELLPLSNPPEELGSPGSGSEGREGYPDTDSDFPMYNPYPDDMQGYTGAEADQYLTVTQSQDGSQIEINTSVYNNNHNNNVGLPHSQSDSTIVCHLQPGAGEQVDYIQNTGGMRKDSHSTDELSKSGQEGLEVQMVQSAASDSGLSSLGSSLASHHHLGPGHGQQGPVGQRGRANSKLTPTSMRKTLTGGMAGFMGKLKNKLDPDDIEDDRMSVATDMSDEDFEFLGFDDTAEAPAFNHGGHRSETASSVDTDDLSSVFADSTSASKAKELVSAIVFRLSGTELLIQSHQEDMFLRLKTKAIESEETGNVVYEEFYSRLSSPQGIIRSPATPQPGIYPLMYKQILGPGAEREAPRGAELGVMITQLHDCSFKFRMSSVLSMTDFIEEEKVGTPMPMHVTIENLSLILEEDRLSPAKSPSESPPPVSLHIDKMFIRRHDDGVFHMTTAYATDTAVPRFHASVVPSQPSSQLLLNGNLPDTSEPSHEDPSSSTTTDPETEKKLSALRNQNVQMKLLLEKLDNHSQDQEQEIETLKNENTLLREKLRSFALSGGNSIDDIDDLRKVNTDLEKDNGTLCERIVTLEESLNMVQREKESLVSTLQLLQEELLDSENCRQRTSSNS